MVVENVKIPEYMEKTYKDLNDNNFKFNYDIGHDNNDNDNLLKILEEVPLKFGEFHIHDGNRKQDHLALSEGEIDLKKYKELALKHDAYVVLEVKQKKDLVKSVPIFNKL